MSPSLNVIVSESSGAGTGIPTGTGVVFAAGATDAGPPPGSPLYVKCQSMTAWVNAFGSRSAASALAYDFANELFEDGPGGTTLYFTRTTDQTATTAALTLNDGQTAPKPTLTVSGSTAGTQADQTLITVASGSGTTFTANTTSSSTSITNLSSTKNIGPGTPISGAGIPASTYIVSVNTGASTAVISNAASATATAVTVTPGTVTVSVTAEDAAGDQIGNESYGPFYTTVGIIAISDPWVTFAQSSGTGFTQNLPAAVAAAPLTGGADPSDLTDASHVQALANFPASLGPGTVCLPGKTSTTAWSGLLAHAASKNRFAVLDMADNTSATSVASAAASFQPGANGGYGMLVQGSLILPGLPGINGGATRSCPGSAAVAALRAQVAQGANQAVAPCGYKWPLSYPLGFTTFSGPIPSNSSTAGCFSSADVQTLESNSVPVNVFANFQGKLCLFGFSTTLAATVELVFDQASAATERMALVADCQTAMAPYLFDDINLATITQLQTDLDTVGLAHYTAGALFDGETGLASQAFLVVTGSPVNTSATAQAKQLNAQITCRIVRYADTVNTTITVIPVTVSLPGAVS